MHRRLSKLPVSSSPAAAGTSAGQSAHVAEQRCHGGEAVGRHILNPNRNPTERRIAALSNKLTTLRSNHGSGLDESTPTSTTSAARWKEAKHHAGRGKSRNNHSSRGSSRRCRSKQRDALEASKVLDSAVNPSASDAAAGSIDINGTGGRRSKRHGNQEGDSSDIAQYNKGICVEGSSKSVVGIAKTSFKNRLKERLRRSRQQQQHVEQEGHDPLRQHEQPHQEQEPTEDGHRKRLIFKVEPRPQSIDAAGSSTAGAGPDGEGLERGGGRAPSLVLRGTVGAALTASLAGKGTRASYTEGIGATGAGVSAGGVGAVLKGVKIAAVQQGSSIEFELPSAAQRRREKLHLQKKGWEGTLSDAVNQKGSVGDSTSPSGSLLHHISPGSRNIVVLNSVKDAKGVLQAKPTGVTLANRSNQSGSTGSSVQLTDGRVLHASLDDYDEQPDHTSNHRLHQQQQRQQRQQHPEHSAKMKDNVGDDGYGDQEESWGDFFLDQEDAEDQRDSDGQDCDAGHDDVDAEREEKGHEKKKQERDYMYLDEVFEQLEGAPMSDPAHKQQHQQQSPPAVVSNRGFPFASPLPTQEQKDKEKGNGKQPDAALQGKPAVWGEAGGLGPVSPVNGQLHRVAVSSAHTPIGAGTSNITAISRPSPSGQPQHYQQRQQQKHNAPQQSGLQMNCSPPDERACTAEPVEPVDDDEEEVEEELAIDTTDLYTAVEVASRSSGSSAGRGGGGSDASVVEEGALADDLDAYSEEYDAFEEEEGQHEGLARGQAYEEEDALNEEQDEDDEEDSKWRAGSHSMDEYNWAVGSPYSAAAGSGDNDLSLADTGVAGAEAPGGENMYSPRAGDPSLPATLRDRMELLSRGTGTHSSRRSARRRGSSSSRHRPRRVIDASSLGTPKYRSAQGSPLPPAFSAAGAVAGAGAGAATGGYSPVPSRGSRLRGNSSSRHRGGVGGDRSTPSNRVSSSSTAAGDGGGCGGCGGGANGHHFMLVTPPHPQLQHQQRGGRKEEVAGQDEEVGQDAAAVSSAAELERRAQQKTTQLHRLRIAAAAMQEQKLRYKQGLA